MALTNHQLKIFSLLRYLHGETLADYVKINLSGLASEYGITNPTGFAPKLVKLGILDRKGTNPAHMTYKWNLDSGPTNEMIDSYFPEEEKKQDPKPAKKPGTIKVNTAPGENLNTDTDDDLDEFSKDKLSFYSTKEIVESLRLRGYSGFLTHSVTL